MVQVPRVAEAFLTMECRLEQLLDLGGGNRMAVGKVLHVAAHEGYMNGLDKRYGAEGFMFNLHSPQNNATGQTDSTAVGVVNVQEVYE